MNTKQLEKMLETKKNEITIMVNQSNILRTQLGQLDQNILRKDGEIRAIESLIEEEKTNNKKEEVKK